MFWPKHQEGGYWYNVSKAGNWYNADAKLDTWLDDYHTLVGLHGGNNLDACRYLPIMLEDTARLWSDSLEEKTIHNWNNMRRAFSQHFQGTYKHPATMTDLQRCTQQAGESMKAFVDHWIRLRNTCEDVNDAQAINESF